MAIRTNVEVIDDLTGEPGAQTYTFAFGNQRYEIDLTSDAPLRDALAPFIAVAHKPGRQRPQGTRNRRGTTHPYDPAVVRAWATKQGMAVSSRGKLSAAVLDAYAARNTTRAPKGTPKKNTSTPTTANKTAPKSPKQTTGDNTP